MAPRAQPKKKGRDATFRPQDDQPSTSTVESGEMSPERQQIPKRKMGDATYRPDGKNPSTSSVEEPGKRSPGRPRKTPKATASRPSRQPRVNSEEHELLMERGVPVTQQRFRTPGIGKTFSSDSSPKLSITDRLKNIRDFLRTEDSTTHPRFRERLDDFDAFIADLPGAKEMFDVGVYHDVRPMLGVARDRMLDQEQEEARKVHTYKVPSWSTTETESSKSSGRDKIFSPDNTRKKSDGTDTTSHHSQDDYGDGDCLQWAHHSPTQIMQGIRPSTGKRPLMEAMDPSYSSKKTKSTQGRDSVVTSSERDRPWSLGDHQYRPDGERVTKNTVIETEDDKEDEEDEGDPEGGSGAEPMGRRLRSGSGSLMPPEIADFEEDYGEPVASAVKKARKEKTSNADEQFWPGDPVFMFGETRYLQALQSRQIEKDLAPQDDETQAAIDRRPLMGMFARFQLPQVNEKPVKKEPKSTSFCTMS
ncbi:MAG: hypothetical protein Q9208_005593 [Pyrenodesmia sp. 3 TL-2023]